MADRLRHLSVEQTRILHRLQSASQALLQSGRPMGWALGEVRFVLEELALHRTRVLAAPEWPRSMSQHDLVAGLDQVIEQVGRAEWQLAQHQDRWAANVDLGRAFITTARLVTAFAHSRLPQRPVVAPSQADTASA